MNQDEKSNLLSRVSLEMGLYAGLLLLAAALRLWGLGLRPLSADEADRALAAWQLYRGLDYGVREPLYLLTTLCSFGLFDASDAAARLAPTLAGTALVALPALLRRQLGRVGALVAAALLAVSPSFVFFSDSADGAMLAVAAGLLLVAGLWRYRESAGPRDLYLAAGGLGLALAAGPAAYPLILVLVAFAAVSLATGRAPRPERPLLIRAGLLCGGVLVVAATVALTRLDGLQEVLVDEPGRWLAAFVAPRMVPWDHTLRLLALYDLAALVLGSMSMGFLLARPVWLVEFTEGARGPFAVFLVLWSLVALLLATLAGGASAASLLVVVLPLVLLAGLFLDRLLDEGLLWSRTRGILTIFVVALVYLTVFLVRLAVWRDQSGSEITFAAILVVLAITALYWTWSLRPRWSGLAGILTVLLVLSFHGAVYSIYPPAIGPHTFLVQESTPVGVRLLLADLDEVEFLYQNTDWAGLDVTIVGAEDSLWGWLLRDRGTVAFVERPDDVQTRVIAAPLEWQGVLDEMLPGYERRRYTLSTAWPGVSFTWNDFIDWLLYRYSSVPSDDREFVVYVRQ